VRVEAGGEGTRATAEARGRDALRGAARGGRAGVRVARRGAVLAIVALTLTGCETTAEQSAKLERAARHARLVEQGPSTTEAPFTEAKKPPAARTRGATRARRLGH
jgi:hypothetical protein